MEKSFVEIVSLPFLIFLVFFIFMVVIVISQIFQLKYMMKVHILYLPFQSKTASAILASKTPADLSLLETLYAYNKLKRNNNPYSIVYKQYLDNYLNNLSYHAVNVSLEYEFYKREAKCAKYLIGYFLFNKTLKIGIC